MSLPPTNLPEWLHWLDSCPSTNTWAIDHLAALHHGDVIFTPRQTAGRGQHGRTWHSPPGVLTTSFVLDRIPIVQLPGFSLAAGLAAIYAIEELIDCPGILRLKWTNDVLLHGRKLAGILCEATSVGSIGRVVMGIGLNRCVDFDLAGLDAKTVGQAISLHQVSSVVPSELELLERLRHYLLQTAGLMRSEDDTGLAVLLPAIRSRDALIEQEITLDLGGEKISGIGAGISDRGHLLLRLPNGEVRSFVSGHVLWSNRDRAICGDAIA
jgi:BirA family transcriptional regulator, biotin operon repressor / biotin---[acetyl-CoA-carboxylase] ligase